MQFGPSKTQLEHEKIAHHHDSLILSPDLTVQELKERLIREMNENMHLRDEIHGLKSELAKVALQFEEEDERVAIGLIKKME